MRLALPLVLVLAVGLVTGCPKKEDASPKESSSGGGAASALPTASAPSGPRGERGTPAEAKAMLDKAAQHYHDVGEKTALADFTAKKAPFFDRDLYVFCIGKGYVLTANGGFPQYVGT